MSHNNIKMEICPVCHGKGLVPNGFYLQTTGTFLSSGTAHETCRTCNGQGYIEIM